MTAESLRRAAPLCVTYKEEDPRGGRVGWVIYLLGLAGLAGAGGPAR